VLAYDLNRYPLPLPLLTMHRRFFSALLALLLLAGQLVLPAMALTHRGGTPLTAMIPDTHLACNTCGGATGAASGVSAAAAAVGPRVSAGVSKTAALTDSLWGNLLLMMAVQRDEEMTRLAKKMKRTQVLSTLSIASALGLGMASSIVSISQNAERVVNVTGAHSVGGHDHVHIPPNSNTPATLSLVGSGVALATLGVQSYLTHRYEKKFQTRQKTLADKLAAILTRLENGEQSAAVKVDLTPLVGDKAAGEFMQLWDATHSL
jgi:hypothetical protein